MNYVFVDESGDTGLTKKSSSYFVMCAVVFDNPDRLRRIARDVFHHKKNKKSSNMLHAYRESDAIKVKLLKKVISAGVRCICYVIKKKSDSVDYYLEGTKAIACYFDKREQIELFVVAKRDTRKSYIQKIKKLYEDFDIIITFADPKQEKALQIADFFSWCVFSKFEKENNYYFSELNNHITIL